MSVNVKAFKYSKVPLLRFLILSTSIASYRNTTSTFVKNLSIPAFFKSALRSGEDGSITVDFTLPDALTQWLLSRFAWTDDYAIGSIKHTIQTQKELMVLPQMQLLLQQGDTIELRAKVLNLSNSTMTALLDQRAAGLEPTNTSNGWRRNDGLHYYVDIRDESFDCYIDRLKEGHYYVGYDLYVRHNGVFANGITTIYSAYAPEFRSLAPSQKINISE